MPRQPLAVFFDGGAVLAMADGGRDHGMGGFVEADQLFPIQLASPVEVHESWRGRSREPANIVICE